jgi:ABC-type transport system involved in multi-copper enzyme maturation permease subunit
MPVAPFLTRELTTSLRRGTAFSARRSGVLLVTLVLVGCVAAWDWWGWDRSSVAGAASFALATAGLVVAAAAAFALGLVPAAVAPLIASERDRKSLDSLLATPYSAADIVLGSLGAGLLRPAIRLAAAVPVLTLLAFLGGIDPRLVLLAAAGLGSTALALAALSIAISAGAPSGARAGAVAAALAITWMCGPLLVVLLLPRIWPAAVPWVVPVALRVLDSSPVEIGLNVLNAIPRGPLNEAVLRMIGLQMLAAALLVLWSIVRLRPASRSLSDRDGRAASRRLGRMRGRSRPPCGDDPVLWRELHSGRAAGPAARLVDRLFNVLWLGLIAYVTSWFAVPAFAELARSGYGASPVTSSPGFDPIARVLVGRFTGLPIGLSPGQARLEFNIVLRQATGAFDLFYLLMVAGAAAESIAVERRRDTWLGLIATPLSGREILRAKMLGAIWNARVPAIVMLALWSIGLLAGAVHPLGFLSALAGLAASSWLLAAAGVAASLWCRDGSQASAAVLWPLTASLGLCALPLVQPGTASVLTASATMFFQSWASLLSYEDVRAVIQSQALPQFALLGISSGLGMRLVLAGWLVCTIAQAAVAYLLTRLAAHGFDAAVGRPTRPRPHANRG